jgi:hypothetical protein
MLPDGSTVRTLGAAPSPLQAAVIAAALHRFREDARAADTPPAAARSRWLEAARSEATAGPAEEPAPWDA